MQHDFGWQQHHHHHHHQQAEEGHEAEEEEEEEEEEDASLQRRRCSTVLTVCFVASLLLAAGCANIAYYYVRVRPPSAQPWRRPVTVSVMHDGGAVAAPKATAAAGDEGAAVLPAELCVELVRRPGVCAPHFLIIGAAKAGTTSLWYFLREHAQVRMPSTKEPMLLSSRFVSTARFLDQFPRIAPSSTTVVATTTSAAIKDGKITTEERQQQQAVTGEASTDYLPNPHAPRRLARMQLAHMRFIVLLRDPAERAYSMYHHFVHDAFGSDPEDRAACPSFAELWRLQRTLLQRCFALDKPSAFPTTLSQRDMYVQDNELHGDRDTRDMLRALQHVSSLDELHSYALRYTAAYYCFDKLWLHHVAKFPHAGWFTRIFVEGIYSRMLLNWLHYHDESRFLIMYTDQLKTHEKTVLSTVTDFLGVQPYPESVARAFHSEQRHNTGGAYGPEAVPDPVVMAELRRFYAPFDRELEVLTGLRPPWASAASSTAGAGADTTTTTSSTVDDHRALYSARAWTLNNRFFDATCPASRLALRASSLRGICAAAE
jgi:hypothetical protein